MVKRICPVCGQKQFSSRNQDVWKCKNCGADIAPELNLDIGEREASKGLINYPVVGQVLANGFKVLAVYKNKFVLAQKEGYHIPQPFAVWYLDMDGDTYSGSYFKNAENAERHFAQMCFKWFEDEKELCVCPL